MCKHVVYSCRLCKVSKGLAPLVADTLQSYLATKDSFFKGRLLSNNSVNVAPKADLGMQEHARLGRQTSVLPFSWLLSHLVSLVPIPKPSPA